VENCDKEISVWDGRALGQNLGQSWAKAGPKLGQSWAKAGPKLGQSWAKAGELQKGKYP